MSPPHRPRSSARYVSDFADSQQLAEMLMERKRRWSSLSGCVDREI
jgi:hypothetical protein